MTLETISFYFSQYGLIAIFIIVLLEYLNLPGFPAGVIMPLAGVFAANGRINFLIALLVSVAAGLVGSWILYFLGLKGGEIFLKAYLKNPSMHPWGLHPVRSAAAWQNMPDAAGCNHRWRQVFST